MSFNTSGSVSIDFDEDTSSQDNYVAISATDIEDDVLNFSISDGINITAFYLNKNLYV